MICNLYGICIKFVWNLYKNHNKSKVYLVRELNRNMFKETWREI